MDAAVEQIGGLQTQYAPSGYVGLWTRLAGFGRDDLTRVLADRTVVQGTLMRATIHIVSPREYWRCAAGVREARRAWLARVDRSADEAVLPSAIERLREAPDVVGCRELLGCLKEPDRTFWHVAGGRRRSGVDRRSRWR